MQHFLASLLVAHFDERAAERVADLLERFRVEVASAVDSPRRPTETGLARVTIDEIEFPPHNYPGARVLALMDDEGAIVETEVLIHLRKHPKTRKKMVC